MKKFIIGAVVLAALVGAAFTAYTAITTRMDEPKGFTVLVNEGGSWNTKGTIAYDLHYTDKSIDLGAAAPDAQGNVTVRVAHGPEGMANIDGAVLVVNGVTFTPKRAVDAESSTDLMRKLAKNDNDVINAQGKTIEFTYTLPRSARTASPMQLTVRGREENPNKIPGGPCTYTATDGDENAAFTYVLGSNKGTLNVNGELAPEDALGVPLFKKETKPISGHPDGFTYGWIKNDDRYLYGAVDFTSDNTFDGTADFSAIQVKTKDGWKEFKVSVGNEKWGKPGFMYTDRVAYQHKVYEFKIPLAELGANASAKEPLQLKFSAYGTTACTVTVAKGAHNPTAPIMVIDPTEPPNVVMQMDVTLTAAPFPPPPPDPVFPFLQSLELLSEGTGDDLNEIKEIKIYRDLNNNGAIDAGDTLLASDGTFTANNDVSTLLDIAPDIQFPTVGATEHLLVVYTAKNTATHGHTFSANTNAFTFNNACSGYNYGGLGLPIENIVTAVAPGTTTLAVGSNNPAATNVAAGQVDVPALQFTLAAGAAKENVQLNSVTLTDAAAAAHSTLVTAVKLWLDADASGTMTAGDTQLNSDQTFTAGVATLALTPNAAHQIAAGATNTYLVTYDFAAAPTTTSWFKRLFGSAEAYAKAIIAAPFSLVGCGVPEGLLVTDESGTALTSVTAGSKAQIRTAAGLPIFEFTMTGDALDLTGATFGRDANGTLVALGTVDAGTASAKAVAGIAGNATAFVPCDTDDTTVRLCADQATLPTDPLACTAVTEGFTWDNTDRTGTDDCRVSGDVAAFAQFYGTGATIVTFAPSIAAAADVALTGVQSALAIVAGGTAVAGGQMTLVAQ